VRVIYSSLALNCRAPHHLKHTFLLTRLWRADTPERTGTQENTSHLFTYKNRTLSGGWGGGVGGDAILMAPFRFFLSYIFFWFYVKRCRGMNQKRGGAFSLGLFSRGVSFEGSSSVVCYHHIAVHLWVSSALSLCSDTGCVLNVVRCSLWSVGKALRRFLAVFVLCVILELFPHYSDNMRSRVSFIMLITHTHGYSCCDFCLLWC
jgi:hypothetical protein